MPWCNLDLTLGLAVVTLTFKVFLLANVCNHKTFLKRPCSTVKDCPGAAMYLGSESPPTVPG